MALNTDRVSDITQLARRFARAVRGTGRTPPHEDLPMSPTSPRGGGRAADGVRPRALRPSSQRSSMRFVVPPSRTRKAIIPVWMQRAGLGSWAIIGMVAVVSLVVFAITKVAAVFIAIFVALLLTAILNPVVNLLSRVVNRWVAVVVALLGFIAVFLGLLTVVVTSVAGQWTRMADQFSNGVNMIADFLQSLPFHITLTAEDISTWADRLVTRAQQWISTNWGSLATDLLSNVGSVATVFTIIALAIFVTIFFLHSGSQMWRWFLNLLPDRYRVSTHRAATAGWGTFSAYARGTMIVAGTDGVLAALFLWIIGVPVAPALGVLVFIGAFIPLFGAPLAMLVAMVVALATAGIFKAALVGVGIALIGQLEGHVLQPLIMSHQVSLHPVVVGLGVAIGTLTAGLVGAIIAIPVIGVIWAVFGELHQGDPPIEGPLPATTRP